MNREILKVSELSKSFQSHEVLHRVSLQVLQGEVLVLIGPSGSGKSTLLRCLNFLEIPDLGEIVFEGKVLDYQNWPEDNFSHHRQRFGMVFQHFHLFSHKTALENVMEGPVSVLKHSESQAKSNALALLKSVRMEGFAEAFPATLSGGQKQRVAIARSLAMSPAVLLLDEITSALDIETIGEVNQVVNSLKDKITMVVVTHDLGFARQIGDVIAYMESGIIVESGPTKEILDNPQSPELKRFLGQINYLT